MPRAVPPMLATSAPSLPEGPDWTYEVKWDGYRAQAVKDGGTVSLASRNLKNITRQFPAVAQALARLNATSAVVDGEVVAIDAQGRPSFQALHHWQVEGLAIVYYAFDLLHLNGRDLTRLPLENRREALRDVVNGSGVLVSEPLPGTAADITSAVRKLGLEGVIAKRRRSTYVAGRRSDAWIKVRFARHQELVIGGYKPRLRSREQDGELRRGRLSHDRFDSLVVGYYDGATLRAAGKVRAGFTPHTRVELFDRMKPLGRKRCPFANLPTTTSSHWGEGITAEEMTAIQWLKPELVAEISFVEWTRDGNLRHARFLGMRDDKPARDIRRES